MRDLTDKDGPWLGLDLASYRTDPTLWEGTFAPAAPGPLDDLVAEYFRRADEYDLTVCTGRMGRDGIMPATCHEYNLVSRNARAITRELDQRALARGYSVTDLRKAMLEYNRA